MITLPSIITSKVCGFTVMFGHASLCSMCALGQLARALGRQASLGQAELALHVGIDRQPASTKFTDRCFFASPNAPHCGRMSKRLAGHQARGASRPSRTTR